MKSTRNIIQFHVRVPFELQREGRLYVSSCAPLDVVSQGTSEQEATANLAEAVRLFIEAAYIMGTLDEVLRECGFVHTAEIEGPTNNLLDVPLHLLAARTHAEAHTCSL